MFITARMTVLATLGFLAVAPIGMRQADATMLPDHSVCERVRRVEVVTDLPVDCSSHAPSDLCEKIRRGELVSHAPVNCGSRGMAIQTGNFCHTPIGRFGPGPVNPVGTQCFVDTPGGRMWGGVGN